jgi:hypothetical protein
MCDPALRELTASEPLTLPEEHAMQQKWQEDDDKLTFIVLARPAGLAPRPVFEPDAPDVRACPMIGDVNLFLKGIPPHMREIGTDEEGDDNFEAEVEVMIAGEHHHSHFSLR